MKAGFPICHECHSWQSLSHNSVTTRLSKRLRVTAREPPCLGLSTPARRPLQPSGSQPAHAQSYESDSLALWLLLVRPSYRIWCFALGKHMQCCKKRGNRTEQIRSDQIRTNQIRSEQHTSIVASKMASCNRQGATALRLRMKADNNAGIVYQLLFCPTPVPYRSIHHDACL